ncbi:MULTISPECIES: FecR domain-containing protein [unclassified Variovorax]|uniref:FecR family protein n=1 Tax=unclassified Variovorax TaxID=663243 RepID=UPI000838C9E6|nr:MULTISPECIES: FecR domain-containing protein [unclassified Variovorax]
MNKRCLATMLCGLLLSGAGALAQTAPASSAASGLPPAAAEHAGILKSVRGKVMLLSADGSARPAQAGDPVAPIDRLQTEAGSAASLVLRDGTTMVVGPSSRLDLKQFHFDSTTHDGGLLVSLLRGSLRMVTGLIGKTQPDAVRVETQTATIGIRGTDFIVEADAAQ